MHDDLVQLYQKRLKQTSNEKVYPERAVQAKIRDMNIIVYPDRLKTRNGDL